MSGAIVVFARIPQRGLVKTRLVPMLGEAATLALYEAFLDDTLEAARATGARVLLAHTPGLAPRGADIVFAQEGDSFGARFDSAWQGARARVQGPLILVGADTPHLGPGAMRAALDTLEDAPSVVGPSTEGGFYLVGARGHAPSLAPAFDSINDGAAVCRILRDAGAPSVLVARTFDVDVPGDLVELVLHIETARAVNAWVPPRTSALLQKWNARVESPGGATRARRLALDLS